MVQTVGKEQEGEEKMKIGETAKATGLSVSNIRFYEKKGLLNPKRREESQYREYGEEDVRRLKEIMLLRKIGLPVESIYLLYQGQAELNRLIQHQQKELREQIESLEGALELCRFLDQEDSIEAVNVDKWLNYVHEEEEKGKKFAQAEELLEDLTEFTRLASFRADPYVGCFFRKHWVARTLAVLLVLSLVMEAVFSAASGGGFLGKGVIWFWGCYLLWFAVQFVNYRKRRHRDA